jgi:hypothetical protein
MYVCMYEYKVIMVNTVQTLLNSFPLPPQGFATSKPVQKFVVLSMSSSDSSL